MSVAVRVDFGYFLFTKKERARKKEEVMRLIIKNNKEIIF